MTTVVSNTLPLGDVLAITSGFAFKSQYFSETRDGLPLIRCRDVNTGLADVYYSGEYDKNYVVKKGELLVSMDGDFRVVRWQHDDALLNQRVCRLEPHTDRLDPGYLFYFLPKELDRIHAKTSFATVKHLSVKTIREIEVTLPPLPEQKRIAVILDKADTVRRKRQEALSHTKGFLKSVFQDMFRDWLGMQSSEMPKLGHPDMAEIASGVTKGRRFDGKETVVVPYIRVANVQDGYLDLSEIKTIEVLPADVESLLLQRGDVLMTEGGDHDKLGRGAMWEVEIPNCIHQNHVFRIRCNRGSLLPEYFAGYIQTGLAKAYFLRCAKKTSNLASINMTQLKATPVPCPPTELQQRYAEIRREHQKSIDTKERALAESDNLFSSLVQRAFKGEL